MELKQKSIEVTNFELEDLFLENLRKFGLENAMIVADFLENIHNLDFISDKVVIYGGMVNITKNFPIFFEVEFLKDLPNTAVLINIELISVDEYLDYINLNLYLKPL